VSCKCRFKNLERRGESLERDLREYYKLLDEEWNPYKPGGYKRFLEALRVVDSIVEHKFIRDIIKRRNKVRILDVCSGYGIGGIALAKVMEEHKKQVDLTLVDIREEVLIRAKKWSIEVLRKPAKTLVLDVMNLKKLGEKFDLIIMYGNSIAHFSPWDLLLLLPSIINVLEDNGVFIVENIDVGLQLLMGYKYIWIERGSKPILNFHASYDILKGTCRRLFFSFEHNEKGFVDLHFWYTSTLGALLFCFFNDLSILSHPWEHWKYYVIVRRPRENMPRITKKRVEEILSENLKSERQEKT